MSANWSPVQGSKSAEVEGELVVSRFSMLASRVKPRISQLLITSWTVQSSIFLQASPHLISTDLARFVDILPLLGIAVRLGHPACYPDQLLATVRVQPNVLPCSREKTDCRGCSLLLLLGHLVSRLGFRHVSVRTGTPDLALACYHYIDFTITSLYPVQYKILVILAD